MGNEKRKRKDKILVLIIAILILVLIGISYAWLSTTVLGNKQIKITADNIDLVLNEKNDGINLVNSIPTYDSDGKKGEPYLFSLENRSSFSVYYTLSLVDNLDELENCSTSTGENCELLDPRDVRYELKMGDRTFTGTLSDSPVIGYGVINESETIDGEIRVWLNVNAENEAMGKAFLGKLKVFGTQELDDFDQNNNVNAPEMDTNMIAVKHDGYTWVKTDSDNDWYNYDRGIWANAVTVKSDKLAEYQSASVGTEIKMDDIETMWVWIPRYSYTIAGYGINYYGKKGVFLESTPTEALPGEIDFKFVGTDVKDRGTAKYLNTDEPSNWYTPDAFTFGDTELSGIWVGKFETSSSDPKANNGGDNTTSYDAMIKPNVTSWRNINVSNIYSVATKVSAEGNRYGFSESMNSHAMKNSEWAVVAYLSQSRYGKLGNENYSGANKEVYQNKSDQYITGCSYGSPSNGNTDYGCQYTYDDNIRTEDGLTGKGVGASTTGTIYGIYDMSGGAWEYVMGNYNGKAASSGFGDPLTIDSKYYDKYTSNNTSIACNGKECLSHGLSERAGWYGDYKNMVSEEYPWLLRGGYYGDFTNAGVFHFFRATTQGSSSSNGSFRLVMSPSI